MRYERAVVKNQIVNKTRIAFDDFSSLWPLKPDLYAKTK